MTADHFEIKLLTHLEQENTAKMSHVAHRLTRAEKRVVDTFARTFLAAKTCTRLPSHKELTKWRPISSSVTISMSQLILIYTLRILNQDTGVGGSSQDCTAVNMYVKALEAAKMQKRVKACTGLKGYYCINMFLPYILYDWLTHFGKEELSQRRRLFQISVAYNL